MDNAEEQKTSKKSKDTKKEEEVSLYSDQKSEQILNFCLFRNNQAKMNQT